MFIFSLRIIFKRFFALIDAHYLGCYSDVLVSHAKCVWVYVGWM